MPRGSRVGSAILDSRNPDPTNGCSYSTKMNPPTACDAQVMHRIGPAEPKVPRFQRDNRWEGRKVSALVRSEHQRLL